MGSSHFKYKVITVLKHGILNKSIVGGSLSFMRATNYIIKFKNIRQHG